jgi:DNA-binding NarL/FixJ family response regulator
MVARYTANELAVLRPEANVRVAGTLAEAEALLTAGFKPDYVLLDLMLPDSHGLFALVAVRKLAPSAVVGVVSGETDPSVMRDCFMQGARGYLTKSTGADEFTEALRKLLDNGFYYPPQAVATRPPGPTHRLSRREVEVLRVLALGKSNKQLAPMLQVSESTFKTYLRSLYEKLGVRTRLEAVRRGEELGFVPLRRPQ